METQTFTYGYSYDEERFHGEYNSRDEAVEAAIDDADEPLPAGATIYTGRRQEPPHPSEFLPGPDDIIDTMACRASDNYGEYAEDWLSSLTDEQKEKLQPHLDAIAQTILELEPPTFYLIGDVQPFVVPGC